MARGTINSWELKSYQAPLPPNLVVENNILEFQGRTFANLKEACGWDESNYFRALIGAYSVEGKKLAKYVTDAGYTTSLKGLIAYDNTYDRQFRSCKMAVFYEIEAALKLLNETKKQVAKKVKKIKPASHTKLLSCINKLKKIKARKDNLCKPQSIIL